MNGQNIYRVVIQHNRTHLQDITMYYVCLAEISMVCSSFYKLFSSLQRLKPNIRYIIVGEIGQLTPVSDNNHLSINIGMYRVSLVNFQGAAG